MQCKEKLEQYLRSAAVPFEVRHHPVAFSAQQVAERARVPGKFVAKVVLVFAAGKPAMLMLPASYRIDLDDAAQALGVESVRLAHESELETLFPDCEIGAMPPFGNLYDIPVYVDHGLAEDQTIVCQAGTHADTISLRYADFARLVEPVVVAFAHSQRALASAQQAVLQMLDRQLEEAINAQLGRELASAYMYLAMAGYFEGSDLPGFGHWMRRQSREELGHAVKFHDHLLDRGAKPMLPALDAPVAEFTSPLEAMEKALAHERYITASIHALYGKSVEVRDYATQAFLQWFIAEQVEEEKTAGQIVGQMKLTGGHGGSLLVLDHRLRKRE